MTTSPPSNHQRKLSYERVKLVHHQRYHQFVKKNGFQVRDDEKEDEESHTLLLDFGNSTSYYKRTTPKLMFLYFSFIFSFLSCCLVLGPQLFSLCKCSFLSLLLLRFLFRFFLSSDLKSEGKHSKKPKLVILSRNGSRAITNIDAMVKMAKQIGFEVEVLRPERTTELAKIYRALNSSDVMIGVHGAAMTHFLFMRPGSVFIQVIPLGADWAAQTYYGDPSVKLGLKYINYNILPRESSLYGSYSKDDPVLKDPESINAMGWEFTKKIYLDGQSVKLELGRFRKRLVRAYDYILQRNWRQRHPRRRHLR